MTLALKNEVSTGLRSMRDDLIKLDERVRGLQERLAKLSETAILPRATEGFSRANLDAQAFDARLREVQRSMRAINDTTIRARIAGTGGYGGSDASSIPAPVSEWTYDRAGRRVRNPNWKEPEREAGPGLHGAFGKIFEGMFIAGAGAAMARSLHSPLESALEMSRIRASMQQKGLDSAQLASAMGFATQDYGLSKLEQAKLMDETLGGFRETGRSGEAALQAAKIMTPVLSHYIQAKRLLGEDKQGLADNNMVQLMKFIELSGGSNDPKVAQQLTDVAFKLTQSSGGMVANKDLMQARAQGAIGWAGMSLPAFIKSMSELEPIMGELGGPKFGTGYSTMYKRTEGMLARMPKASAEEFLRLGLWDAHKAHQVKGGGYSANPGVDPTTGAFGDAMRNGSVLDQVLAFVDAAGKHGIKGERALTNEAYKLFGDTGAKLVSAITRQLEVIEKSQAAYKTALTQDQLIAQQKDSPQQQLIELQNQWRDLMTDLGTVVLPMAIDGLKRLIPMLRELTAWVRENPEKVKLLTYAFIGLAGALMFSGTVLMLRGAFMALGGSLPGVLPTSLAGSLAANFATVGGALSAVNAIALSLAAGWAVGTLANAGINAKVKEDSGGRWGTWGDKAFNKTHDGDGNFSFKKAYKFAMNSGLEYAWKSTWNPAHYFFKYNPTDNMDADDADNPRFKTAMLQASYSNEGRGRGRINTVQSAPMRQDINVDLHLDSTPIVRKTISIINGQARLSDFSTGNFDTNMFAPVPSHTGGF
ncbi:MAG: phage tail tape measure protein [Burkholderiales bacterium]|nr:phage tail tape measure protein [Burkholderiales bacterium]